MHVLKIKSHVIHSHALVEKSRLQRANKLVALFPIIQCNQ